MTKKRGRLKGEESDCLAPRVLTPDQTERIYGANTVDEKRECNFGKAAFAALRRAARKGRRA